ncbi:MAG: DUF4364 family protein [Lachnospiraceae bacterium]|nr:DUF4364 family protein [Lachnospiraceae bacterium]
MPDSQLTQTKLLILYMLDRVDFPLTQAQISDLLLTREYTNYIELSQALAELADAGMVHSQTMHNRTHLSLTKDGLDTLHYFENRISYEMKEGIKEYLSENKISLRDEVSILSEYYRGPKNSYQARLIAKDSGSPLIEITLSVPDEEIAAHVCDSWQKQSQDIYQYVVNKLF